MSAGSVQRDNVRDWKDSLHQRVINAISSDTKATNKTYSARLHELRRAEVENAKHQHEKYLKIEFPLGFTSISGDHRIRTREENENKMAKVTISRLRISFFKQVSDALERYVDGFPYWGISEAEKKKIMEDLDASVQYHTYEFVSDLNRAMAEFPTATNVRELKGILEELEEDVDDTIDALQARVNDIMKPTVKSGVGPGGFIRT